MTSEIAVLLYPGCLFFEVALAVETLARQLPVRCYTPTGEPLLLANGLLVQPAGSFADLETKAIRAVLVPGGDPGAVLLPNNLAARLLDRAAQSGALVAGICAGNLVMAASGLLRGRRGTHNFTPEHATPQLVDATKAYWDGLVFERADIVQDGQLITAQPWAYRQYAAAVAKALGVMSTDEASDLATYPERRRYNAVWP